MEQNRKAGQNPPRVVAPTEEEEEECPWLILPQPPPFGTSHKLRIDVRFENDDSYSGNSLFQSICQVKFCSTNNENYLQDVYLKWGRAPVPLER